MAKTKLNATLETLSGSIGGLIFRRGKSGPVVSEAPDMSGVKASPKQRVVRDKIKYSGSFYFKVLASPALKEQYAAAAKLAGMSLRNFCTSEYFRRLRKPDAERFMQPKPLVIATAVAPVPPSEGPPPAAPVAPPAPPLVINPPRTTTTLDDLSAFGY